MSTTEIANFTPEQTQALNDAAAALRAVANAAKQEKPVTTEVEAFNLQLAQLKQILSITDDTDAYAAILMQGQFNGLRLAALFESNNENLSGIKNLLRIAGEKLTKPRIEELKKVYENIDAAIASASLPAGDGPYTDYFLGMEGAKKEDEDITPTLDELCTRNEFPGEGIQIGYSLCLMSSLSDQAEAGKIYIDQDTRAYKVLGENGELYQGELPKEIDLNELSLNPDNLVLKMSVFDYISRQGHIQIDGVAWIKRKAHRLITEYNNSYSELETLLKVLGKPNTMFDIFDLMGPDFKLSSLEKHCHRCANRTSPVMGSILTGTARILAMKKEAEQGDKSLKDKLLGSKNLTEFLAVIQQSSDEEKEDFPSSLRLHVMLELIKRNKIEEMQILLDNNLCDVSYQNRLTKQGALHFAIEEGNVNAIRFLVENGADIFAQNKSGKTPLTLIFEKDQPALLNAMLDGLAKCPDVENREQSAKDISDFLLSIKRKEVAESTVNYKSNQEEIIQYNEDALMIAILEGKKSFEMVVPGKWFKKTVQVADVIGDHPSETASQRLELVNNVEGLKANHCSNLWRAAKENMEARREEFLHNLEGDIDSKTVRIDAAFSKGIAILDGATEYTYLNPGVEEGISTLYTAPGIDIEQCSPARRLDMFNQHCKESKTFFSGGPLQQLLNFAKTIKNFVHKKIDEVRTRETAVQESSSAQPIVNCPKQVANDVKLSEVFGAGILLQRELAKTAATDATKGVTPVSTPAA